MLNGKHVELLKIKFYLILVHLFCASVLKFKTKKMSFIKTVFLLLPFLLNAQNIKISIVDKFDKKPLKGIQFFSENGSLIGNSNLKGEFEFNKILLQQSEIKSIMVYDSNYLPIEYQIDEIPEIIYLEKIKSYELEPVIIIKKLSTKYYTLEGYIRSWKLVNNKLIKYGDAIIEYHIPYENSNNDFATGIKNYVTEYRTFKIDSVKQKSRIISISGFDDFLNYRIPVRDILTRELKRYKLEKTKDSLYAVIQEGKNVGYTINDKYNNHTEINVNEFFEGKEAVKILFWKFSGSYNNIEKWAGEGDIRHLSYLFSSQKKMVETKTKGKYNAVETINEIFINDKIIYNDKKPQNSKTSIDKDRSFYNTEFWKEQIKKHPLPSAINQQLINVNENKNSY
jgi:hypothetical protein